MGDFLDSEGRPTVVSGAPVKSTSKSCGEGGSTSTAFVSIENPLSVPNLNIFRKPGSWISKNTDQNITNFFQQRLAVLQKSLYSMIFFMESTIFFVQLNTFLKNGLIFLGKRLMLILESL